MNPIIITNIIKKRNADSIRQGVETGYSNMYFLMV